MRVIYTPSDLLAWVDVAQLMYKNHSWTPTYWIAPNKTQEKKITEIFPGLFTHDFYNGNLGDLSDPPHLKRKIVLDAPCLEKYSTYEKIVLKMMDRLDPTGYSFDYNSRVNRYKKLLSYWISIVQETKPDIALFSETPHSPFTYILYAVCKEENIRIVRYVPTHIDCMVFIDGGLEGINKESNPHYDELYSQSNKGLMDQYVSKILGSYDDAMPYYMDKVIRKNDRNSLAKKLLGNLLKIARFLSNPPPSYLENVGRNDGITRGCKLIYYKIYGYLKKKSLKYEYKKLSVSPDYSKTYIYIPLHYQPEKTTSPEGGIYVDQALMIELVLAAIPKDWFVYVKEHPSQFSNRLYGEQGRSDKFYRDINALSNVKLINIDEDSFRLIDNAKAVATVTGTAGLEAVIRGCPTLVFGYAWYKGCPGIHPVYSYNDLKLAIEKISNGVPYKLKDVKKFLYTIEHASKAAYLNPGNRSACTINEEENTQALYELLDQHEKRFHKK